MRATPAVILSSLLLCAVCILLWQNFRDQPELRSTSISLVICLREYAKTNDGRFPSSLEDHGFLEYINSQGVVRLLEDVKKFQRDPSVTMEYIGSAEALADGESPILVVQKLRDDGPVGFTILANLGRIPLSQTEE